jgi:hypothetical protein
MLVVRTISLAKEVHRVFISSLYSAFIWAARQEASRRHCERARNELLCAGRLGNGRGERSRFSANLPRFSPRSWLEPWPKWG